MSIKVIKPVGGAADTFSAMLGARRVCRCAVIYFVGVVAVVAAGATVPASPVEAPGVTCPL
jgi:hypothetical protein